MSEFIPPENSTVTVTTTSSITTSNIPAFVTPNPSVTPSVSSSTGVDLGTVVGAAVGGVLFLLCVIAAFIFVIKRRRKAKERLDLLEEDDTRSFTQREHRYSGELESGQGDWNRIEPFEFSALAQSSSQVALSRLEKVDRSAQSAAHADEITREDLPVPPSARRAQDRAAIILENSRRNNLPERAEDLNAAVTEKLPYPDEETSSVPPNAPDTDSSRQDIDLIASRVVEMLRVHGLTGTATQAQVESISARAGEQIAQGPRGSSRPISDITTAPSEALPRYEA